MSEVKPYDHADLGLPVLEYLASRGVCADPMVDQRLARDVPATFLGILDDQPDRAIGFLGPWPQNDDPGNPMVRFMIVGRGAPGDQLGVMQDMDKVYRALWTEYGYDLTTNRPVSYCERVQIDPPVMPDENGRYRRVDTYTMRVRVPRK